MTIFVCHTTRTIMKYAMTVKCKLHGIFCLQKVLFKSLPDTAKKVSKVTLVAEN